MLSTLGAQKLPEIALSVTVFKESDFFHFGQNSRWQPKIGKDKFFFRSSGGVVLSTLRSRHSEKHLN